MPCATPEQKAKACALYLRQKFLGKMIPQTAEQYFALEDQMTAFDCLRIVNQTAGCDSETARAALTEHLPELFAEYWNELFEAT
jgi:hypothetical protein